MRRLNGHFPATIEPFRARLLGRLILPATCVVLLALPVIALADGDGLAEIVVTAQKRAQSLQDVGVSVTAQSGEELRNLGVTDTLQLGAIAPGLEMNSASGGNYGAQLTIRGVAQSDYSPHQESPNSMYVDDVYVSAPNAQGGNLFDISRVEVLRGPQGTLFGRNSTGGLVNFITNKPTDHLEAYGEVTGGEFNMVKFEGAVSGPLAEGLRGRLAVATANNSGYVENHLAGYPDTNTTDFRGFRGQLAYDVTSNVTILGTLFYTHDNDREGFYGHFASYYNPADGGRPDFLPPNVDAWGTGPGNDAQGYRSPYTGPEGEFNYIGFLRRSLLMPTVRIDWNWDNGITVTSLANWTRLQFDYDESCAGAAPQLTCRDPYSQNLRQWSEELRIGKTTENFTWVAGFYGLGIHQQNRGAFNSPYYSGTAFAFDSYNPISQVTNSEALFGQVEWVFAPGWRGTLGLRGTHDRKSFSSQTYLNESGDFVSTDTVYNPPLLVSDFSQSTVGSLAVESENNWSGKVQLDRIISKDFLLYASISRGVKGGGFNSNVTAGTANADIPFKPERMFAYEIGEKITALDRRLRINGSVFYYDYRDFQAYQLLRGASPFVSNDNGHFMGGELEIALHPMQGLDLSVAGSGLSTKIYNVATAQIGTVDQQAPDAPKWSGNAMARYSWRVGPGTAAVQWSSDYVGGRYHSVDNIPLVYVHSSIGHNARVSYALDHWEVSAFVNNLTNAVRETVAYDLTSTGGYGNAGYMPPRWWGASVRYEFGK